MDLDKDKLLALYPRFNSVRGPYLREDGRKHVILYKTGSSRYDAGVKKTISYPKALVEVALGRRLLVNETVDHKDRDKTNDSLDNLVVIDRIEHIRLDSLHVKVDPMECPVCGNKFTPTVSQRNQQNRKIGYDKAGPFCSKNCAGKYGTLVQYYGLKINRLEVKKTYYRLEK